MAGFLTGFPVIIDSLATAYTAAQFEGKSGLQLMIGIGVVLIGAYAKDHNVSGK